VLRGRHNEHLELPLCQQQIDEEMTKRKALEGLFCFCFFLGGVAGVGGARSRERRVLSSSLCLAIWPSAGVSARQYLHQLVKTRRAAIPAAVRTSGFPEQS